MKVKKCSSYRERIVKHSLSDYEKGYYYGKYGISKDYELVKQSYCIGTKEYETCTCDGDKSKCNFHYFDKKKDK